VRWQITAIQYLAPDGLQRVGKNTGAGVMDIHVQRGTAANSASQRKKRAFMRLQLCVTGLAP